MEAHLEPMTDLTSIKERIEKASKLTKPQLEMLRRAERHTYNDNSGKGVIPNDGIEVNILVRLADKGLVSLPSIFTNLSGARITDAGRSALITSLPREKTHEHHTAREAEAPSEHLHVR